MSDPTNCRYAPPGEYIKDHTIFFHDGWWHLYSISGTEGYYHAFTGNEETISWSVSRDLVDWEMRGHVLHASQREGAFDQHEVWAPFCARHEGRYHMFYTGVVHPHRPLSFGKPGRDHIWIYDGHRETIGLAVSDDLTQWIKVADVMQGLSVDGRDPHVVHDESNGRWILYSTGPRTGEGLHEAFAAVSGDLRSWEPAGVCARIPDLENHRNGNNESLCVMRHPLDGEWIMLANWQYAKSGDPLNFPRGAVVPYECVAGPVPVEIGLAGEMIQWQGKWYRSGYFGGNNNATKLGFTEIEWVSGQAFRVARPSVMA